MRAKPYLCYEKILSTAARGFGELWRKYYHISLSQTPLNGPLTFPGSYILGGKKTQKKTGEVPL